jgi:hypothetical protein
MLTFWTLTLTESERGLEGQIFIWVLGQTAKNLGTFSPISLGLQEKVPK